MKTAIILHGNVRTFFMPLREDRRVRVCDLFRSNILEPNGSDLFLVTDVTDFYHDGIQYFIPGQSYSKRTYHVVGFMDPYNAREILKEAFKKVLGDSIKALDIQDPINLTLDQKFVLLDSANALTRSDGHKGGCFIDSLVNQYRKIKSAHDLLLQYEKKNQIRYDLIFRGRFDLMYGNSPLHWSYFNYDENDIFVPGPGGSIPFVYDWSAFGTRPAMDLALDLYDNLGFTLSNRLYRCECKKCGSVELKNTMSPCLCEGEMQYDEMSLSSEYHLYQLFKNNGIRYSIAYGSSSNPYRYHI